MTISREFIPGARSSSVFVVLRQSEQGVYHSGNLDGNRLHRESLQIAHRLRRELAARRLHVPSIRRNVSTSLVVPIHVLNRDACKCPAVSPRAETLPD